MLSVVIPVYNAATSLKKCVESVLNQGISDLEVVLVDDGSKDNSIEVCRELSKFDSRVKVFQKENGGAASARNLGLEKCKGDYVCFLDSDDFFENNYLKVLLEKIQQADLVICSMKILRTEGEESKDIRKFGREGIISQKDFYLMYEERDFEGVFSSCCNKIYKKQLITEKFKNLLIGEDKFFNYDYLKNCANILVTNEIGYNYVYYTNPSSVTKLYKDGKFENILEKYNKELCEANLIFGEDNIVENKKYLNRILLRDLTSIMVGLLFSAKDKKEIKNIITSWVNNETIKNATKSYAYFGFEEKIIFKLIKLRFVGLIMLLCRMKGEKNEKKVANNS